MRGKVCIMSKYADIGRKMYDLNNHREFHRYIVFRIRCAMHPKRMSKIDEFFSDDTLFDKIAKQYPFVYEIPTRAFFYNKSTFSERLEIVKQNMCFLASRLNEQDFLDLYNRNEKILWRMEENEPMQLALWYDAGQRKEGLLSICLKLGDIVIYQMIFWISRNSQGEWSLWIGAMQGPNIDNAREVIKRVTKRCHAYRTKNLILHATQEVARSLGVKHIYAVTNYGYYANNHIRRDRKLKTDFSQFWEESGGEPCADKRFYKLPMIEYRKKMEEIPARKRASYRRRFALLDEIDTAIVINMKRYRRV